MSDLVSLSALDLRLRVLEKLVSWGLALAEQEANGFIVELHRRMQLQVSNETMDGVQSADLVALRGAVDFLDDATSDD